MKLTKIIGLLILTGMPFFFNSCIILSSEQMWKIEWDENSAISDQLVIWNQTGETVSVKVKISSSQASEPSWDNPDSTSNGVGPDGTVKLNSLSIATDDQIWIKVTSESSSSGYFAVGSHTYSGIGEEDIQAIVFKN